MSGKEIKVSTFELANSAGNLKALASNWAAMPALQCEMSASRGWSANNLKDLPFISGQVSQAFSDLINNSADFLSAVGVSFTEADNTAAENVDSLSS